MTRGKVGAIAGSGIIVVALCTGILLRWYRQPPPGHWAAGRSLDEMRRGWGKEQEWAKQPFAPIRDDPSFFQAIRGMPFRVQTALHPEQLVQLQQLIYDQLVCRQTGSLSCYRDRFVPGRQAPLDQDRRKRIGVKFPLVLHVPAPEKWDVEEVFEQFWNAEYGDAQPGRRFQEVALGYRGSLFVIGEVSSAMPESFFTEEEIKHWKAWPGTLLWRSPEFHVGKRSLDSLLERNGKCTYAEGAMIIRSANGEIWSWICDWYWDEIDARWQVHMSVAATNRDRSNVSL